ncbi:hypothetical protein ACLOJK_013096 [Asimina triloba]
MAATSWTSFFLRCFSYPEIFLAVASFFLLRSLGNKKYTSLVNWPILGMLPSLLLNVNRLHEWYTQVLREAGGTILFKGPWLANMDMVVTCDPDNVNYILSTVNFGKYPKGQEFVEIFDVLGDGILNADYDSWRIQRKMAHTLVRYRRFRQYVVESCREKVENGLLPLLTHLVRNSQVVDLEDVLQRFTFDLTGLLVFGTDPGCLSPGFPTVPFAKAVDDVKEVILLRHTVPRGWWKLMRWLNVGMEKLCADSCRTIEEFIQGVISTRRDKLMKRGKKMGQAEDEEAIDLLTSYIAYQHGEEMDKLKSDTFLRDTTLNMLVAGRDTTSAALSWFFWVLSKNPSAEIKISEEMRAIPWREKVEKAAEEEETDEKLMRRRVFEAEELNEMVYLQAALCESLRLFSPVPLVHKKGTVPDVLPSGTKIRPGTRILYSLFAMGRMESIWGRDCMEFKPERWINEEDGRLKSMKNDKYLVFNSGPRTCLGKDISFAQMKAVAAAVLYNFEIQVVDGQVVTPSASVVLKMKNGLMVKVRERQLARIGSDNGMQ